MSRALRSAGDGQTPLAVSVERAGELCGVSKFTLRRFVSRGVLPACRVGRRLVIRVADLEKFLAESVVENTAPQREDRR